jgi:diguanylate cyclase (GGDEF)-like protein/PAS domain S-box-containing protein
MPGLPAAFFITSVFSVSLILYGFSPFSLNAGQKVDYSIFLNLAGIFAVLLSVGFLWGRKIKRIKDLLLESERSKSVLLKNLQGMAYRCKYDPEWTMEFVSDGCYELTGYYSHELIDNCVVSFNQIIAEEYRAYIRDKWSEACETGKRVQIEYEITTSSGERKWVWEQGVVIFGDKGEVEALEGLIVDISQRKVTELCLKESQQRYEELSEKSRTYSWEVNTEGLYTFVSTAAEGILGYRPDELVGKKYFYDLCTPGDKDMIRAFGENVLSSGKDVVDFENKVVSKNGSVLWVLSNGIPLLDRRGRVRGFRGTDTDITQRKKMADSIAHMALHDHLTGLPNRTLFEDRVKMALASASRTFRYSCVMFMDLDNFKPVNDNYGHGTGDLLLKEVAARIKDLLRESDTAARIGGDEFVILLPEINDIKDGLKVGEKLCSLLCLPFNIEGHKIEVSASVGIAVFPVHGKDMKELAKNADRAMYDAKAFGRNRALMFSGEKFN